MNKNKLEGTNSWKPVLAISWILSYFWWYFMLLGNVPHKMSLILLFIKSYSKISAIVWTQVV